MYHSVAHVCVGAYMCGRACDTGTGMGAKAACVRKRGAVRVGEVDARNESRAKVGVKVASVNAAFAAAFASAAFAFR
jgi:hypothetical protein